MPGPDLLTDRLSRLGTDGGREAHKEASPTFRQAAPEGIAEKVEADTVVLAGPYGGYGNYIRIQNDGDGRYETAYGHIVDGGTLVSIGQRVQVGQNIARVGSTGMSTGCHLHFEIHHDGGTQDPVPFLRSMGVELAN